MTQLDFRSIEDGHLAPVYARKPVTLVRGQGVLVYDTDGKEYLDCAGGYGTCSVGHAHPRVVDAISKQASSLIACHASTYNDARARLLENLVSILPQGLDRFYLGNSGAEAVECALKIVRKSTGRREIVAMKGGFHGKTHGALSATWDSKYRKNFEPLLSSFVHISYGDAEEAKSSISPNTAAVIVEPIQGEGGVRIPPPDWLPLLRDLTLDSGALLIADEIQTGFGRTGRILACEHSGVTPDIVCMGKGLASGLPIGVTAASDNTMRALGTGEHTSTFGGGPVVSAAASATIEVLQEERLVENARRVGELFKQRLGQLQKSLRIMREVRGLGLMIGVEMRFDVLAILQSALASGLLMLDAGRNILRFLPPLSFQSEHVDRAIEILRRALESEQLAKLPC